MSKTVTRRGQSKAPQALKILIDVANRKDRFPNFAELFAGAETEIRLSKLLKSLNKEQREYLGSPTSREEFRNRYDAFRTAQSVLPKLPQLNGDGRDEFDHTAGVLSLPPVNVELYATSDGRIAASGYFLNALNGVPADRIRSCAICGSIFWAVRKNSECCSQQHRKAYNKQQSRKARRKKISTLQALQLGEQ